MADSAHKQFLAQFVRHRDGIYAFVCVLVRDRVLVEDVFQEASLILWERYGTFQEGTNFGAWARQVALNVVRNARRRESRIKALLNAVAEDAVLAAFDRVGEKIGEEELRTTLKGCMDKLSRGARSLVELRYYEELQLGQIAEKLGRTMAGVNSALCKVRAALEACLRQEGAHAGR